MVPPPALPDRPAKEDRTERAASSLRVREARAVLAPATREAVEATAAPSLRAQVAAGTVGAAQVRVGVAAAPVASIPASRSPVPRETTAQQVRREPVGWAARPQTSSRGWCGE